MNIKMNYRQVIGLNNVLTELGNRRLSSMPIELVQQIFKWQTAIEGDIGVIQKMVSDKSNELGIKIGQGATEEDLAKNAKLQPKLNEWQVEKLFCLTTELDGQQIPISAIKDLVSVNQYKLLAPIVDNKK